MLEMLRQYIEISKKIRELKAQQQKLGTLLLSGMLETNNESMLIGNTRLSIYYLPKYEYDKNIIRDILDPKGLFLDVVSIMHKDLNAILESKDKLTDDEAAGILDCVTVTCAQPRLGVRLNGN